MNFRSIITLLYLLHFSCLLFGQNPIQVEPPSWWIGMKNKKVQLMLHGQNIGHLTATCASEKGIKIINISNPGSQNYLFVDMEVSPNRKPGNVTILLQEDRNTKYTLEYPLLARTEDSENRVGYEPKDVIYLITPDRFSNGDPANDAMKGMKENPDRTNKGGRHGGDIEGIRQHLDYIADLGFTAIWSNPVLEDNMPKYSYHGYAITDFYKVDPRMGTNESYKALCQEAKEKGIKFIMDMVVNHCGSEHPWMKDPPTKDWINYYQQTYTETNHRKTLQTDPYAAPEDLTILQDGWFEQTMPDLNVRNPYLATYLIQNTLWWIEYAGLSGIRMDTYLYPDEKFMTDWSRCVMQEYPNFNITGEVWYDNPAIVAYWQRGKVNKNGYVSYLPSLFDFPMQSALRKALMTNDIADGGWLYLYEMLAQDFQYPAANQLVVFPDNHDMPRILAQLDGDIAKFKMAIAYTLTVRGIPELYYGTEILMSSPQTRDDGLVRSDFPGGWNGDETNAFSGSGLTAEQRDAQQYIKRIVTWRKTATAIYSGQTTHYAPEKGVYVYFRYNDQQKVMIILNKNKFATTLDLARFKNMLGTATEGTEIISGKSINLEKALQLSEPGPMIIDLK